ncbi:UDP-N-acetylmuramoyl-L-alanyl-D-glutamate--2,6-diaminopimelate ligase [Saccharibacter floricola]|uniref:UDP-N-acetylmuramoyl-L-alanyl-D-glutamate--2,6-diaminopimelate ligase n=1 Tax=Saccharibacter floricola DSM 15669 TaxID=1123227 RepID=A0ABQ0NVT5_9PROT|nr:UDP-N-acetylmuramoyl-L-alanyl-D-glutamate--2,6-diaminopimelate ligase [Saccharibacter floricola]GBQ04533.1 UDP-N-acetylmuramoylalanyl-D-glutamate--2, 6-diaminopimelate ligase [Saccharibacter floricola DSM 15669]
MLLSTLLSRYGITPALAEDPTIKAVTADSRHVSPDSLFVAIRGQHHDGAKFIPLAITAGATAIVTMHDNHSPPIGEHWEGERKAIIIRVHNPAHFLAQAAAWVAAPLPEHIIAVTGTNGKSSTVDFLRQLWQLRGKTAASLGTLGVITQADTPPMPAMTTPDAVALASMLSTLQRSHVTHVALEASSHGLHQHRLDGLPLAAAGFSNLTRDHLDYHETIEAYRDAKLRLFRDLLPPGNVAVINADMDPDTYNALTQTARQCGHILRDIGINATTLRLLEAQPTPQGHIIRVALHGEPLPDITLPFPGRFQVDNALMAAALCWEEDAEAPAVLALLSQLRSVPGRCERVADLSNGAAAYVDYAHTPDALEHVLLSLRPHTRGKLHVIFGAGGDRDSGKRPLMGQIAAHIADRITITDDNPRSEDPATIRAAILAACPHAQEIGDRWAAIEDGLKRLGPGDILLIAGKGHETGQVIGSTTHPFDDRALTRSLAEKVSL